MCVSKKMKTRVLIIFGLIGLSISFIPPSFGNDESCNLTDDLKNQEELIKDDVVLIEFMKVLPGAQLTRATGVNEPEIPQTSVSWSAGVYSLEIHIMEYDENNPSDCFFPAGYRLNAPHLPEMTGMDYHKSPQIVLDQIDELEPKYVKGGPAPEPTDGFTLTEMPFHENQNANELPSYVDAKSSLIISENAVILSSKELDRTLDELRQSGLPIVMSAIDYGTGVIAIWTPDLTSSEKFKAELGDIPFVLLYEEAPHRWETGDPGENGVELEPYPDNHDRLCPPGLVLVEYDLCVEKCPSNTKPNELGVCQIRDIEKVHSIGSDGSPLPFLGGLVLVFGIIGLIIYIVKRKEEN